MHVIDYSEIKSQKSKMAFPPNCVRLLNFAFCLFIAIKDSLRYALTCILLSFFMVPLANCQQPTNYQQRMAVLRNNIERHLYDPTTGYYKEFDRRDSNDHKKYSYLWPLCGLIQAAVESDAVGVTKNYTQEVLGRLRPYHDTAPPAPGYNAYLLPLGREDRFYDDNQWIGIACIDAYSSTGDAAYLRTAAALYRFMMTGFDTTGGGGLYWKEGDPTTKNTCSNGPGAVLALKLYQATKSQAYLDTALLLYNWVNNTLQAPEGVYYDHLILPQRTVDKRLYTYNAGTLLESSVLLYEITGDRRYLNKARNIAAAAYKTFYVNNRWPHHYWFNVVLLRGYEALLRHDANPVFMNAFVQEGEAIWQHDRNAQNLVGTEQKKNLLDQAAVLELYARLKRHLQTR